jgi:hypothetical protein
LRFVSDRLGISIYPAQISDDLSKHFLCQFLKQLLIHSAHHHQAEDGPAKRYLITNKTGFPAFAMNDENPAYIKRSYQERPQNIFLPTPTTNAADKEAAPRI